MIRFFATLLLLWPMSANAENVVVRSGDHADFSRLLLEYDGGLDWAFGRVDGGYEFRAGRTNLDWDLRAAFDRISRARIRALEDRGEGRLFMAVDCPCHADAFVLRNGQVVLDIKDGPPPFASSPYEVALAVSDPVGASGPDPGGVVGPRIAEHFDGERAPSTGFDLEREGRARRPLPLPLHQGDGFEAPSSESSPSVDRSPATLSPVDPSAMASAAAQSPPDRVAATEAALIDQIARAAAQGMIEADLSRIEGDIYAATHPLAPPAPEPAASPAPAAPAKAVTPLGHVAIETGIDRASPARAPDRAATDEGGSCIDPALFDIASWGGPTQDATDIGAYRSRIIGEFDLANGAGVTDLARHYLFITFGAEAKALLAQFPDDVVRPDLLRAMAEIMDHGHADAPEILVDQMACAGATALWAALAQPELFRGQSINTQAVALAFSGLPPHLRRHLGPGLADSFLDIEDIATAERIRNSIARGVVDEQPALALLSARLDFASGDVASATRQLDEVITQESDVLPSALMDLVESALVNHEAVGPDQISLLQSLAFEHEGTELGAKLTEMEIRARAHSGDLEKTFDRLSDAMNGAVLTADRIALLFAEAFTALTRDAADVTFLKLAVEYLDEAITLASPLRREISRRFLELGLPAPARRVLGGEGAVPDKPDRLLFAQAALIEGRPEVAVGYLAGLEGDDANLMRAEAMEQAGDFAQAARMFDIIGLDDRGERAAWRGGLWEDVARGSGTLAAAAAMMIGQPPKSILPSAVPAIIANAAAPPSAEPVAPAPRPTLARARALVDESRAMRAVLDELFQAIGPRDNPPGS